MNCASCKHWSRYTGVSSSEILLGKRAGTCSNEHFMYDRNNILVDGLAYWDDDYQSASFATGEDFGCIHWEQEPQAEYEAGRRYLFKLLGSNPSPKDIAKAIKVADHDHNPTEYTKGWLDAAKELLECSKS